MVVNGEQSFDQTDGPSKMFYLLICMVCAEIDSSNSLPIPFETPEARREWAKAHREGTGHNNWGVKNERGRLQSG
jgi:hypothetical protein